MEILAIKVFFSGRNVPLVPMGNIGNKVVYGVPRQYMTGNNIHSVPMENIGNRVVFGVPLQYMTGNNIPCVPMRNKLSIVYPDNI